MDKKGSESNNQNKISKAVALKYEPSTDNAPTVVAAGRGAVADEIVKRASQHNVPIYKNPYIADALSLQNPGTEIPPELYEAVAEILVFIAQMDSDYRKKIIDGGEKIS
jgi:flagellar biosynthesis protein